MGEGGGGFEQYRQGLGILIVCLVVWGVALAAGGRAAEAIGGGAVLVAVVVLLGMAWAMIRGPKS